MITIDRLKYFIEVATREHVGQAAKALAVSPSVVSSAISTLEQEFGLELFHRQNNRLKLNEHGRILLERAKRLLEGTAELYDCFSSDNLSLRGHFRLGGSHFLLQEHVIPAVLKLQAANPELTVELIALDSGIAVSQILSGQLDVALVFRSSYYEELEEQILYSGQFTVAVRKGHPILKLSKKLMVQQLNQLPAITFRTSYGPNFWETHPAFKALGLQPKHSFFYEDTQTAVQLLTKTDGWAFLPDLVVEKTKQIEGLELIGSKSAPVNVSLIQNKNKKAALLVNKLLEQLSISSRAQGF